MTANLSRFGGQVVVLELAVDGNQTGVSESIAWHEPALAAEAPAKAETDDGGKPPTGPDSETIDLR